MVKATVDTFVVYGTGTGAEKLEKLIVRVCVVRNKTVQSSGSAKSTRTGCVHNDTKTTRPSHTIYRTRTRDSLLQRPM